MSVGANTTVKVADDMSRFRVASAFQEALTTEAQDISTVSIPYDDLESFSRYPTVHPQPILLGFSLPSHYFSYTAKVKIVVNVFRQLVSFVRDHEAWDKYTTWSTSTDYALAQVRDPSLIFVCPH